MSQHFAAAGLEHAISFRGYNIILINFDDKKLIHLVTTYVLIILVTKSANVCSNIRLKFAINGFGVTEALIR